MQSTANPFNCPFKYVNFAIAVSESCESTAAVNVSMNLVHFKGSPLKEVKFW